MKVVIDIETDGLVNPQHIWVIVCKDIDTGEYHIFRNLMEDEHERQKFREFDAKVSVYIGHSILDYDWPVLQRLIGVQPAYSRDGVTWFDTVVMSKLVDYSRPGHSVEDYGQEFGYLKGLPLENGDVLESKYFPLHLFKSYSKDLENYCIRDVDIAERIYNKLINHKFMVKEALDLEQRFKYLVCNELSNKGFFFNTKKAKELLTKVILDLKELDESILNTFTPRLKLVRLVTPKGTKYGTISLSSIPKALRESVADLTIDAPFCYCRWSEFNPASHRQIVDVLNQAGWRPVDKTQTHIDTEREYNRAKYTRLDTERKNEYISKLYALSQTGWKVNENNLETLPPSAPSSAKLLAKRILLESRRRTLTEWLGLVDPSDLRIRGKFNGIGAWTHRMNHQSPNTANIPNEYDTAGKKKLLGKELRSLWCAPKNRLLVGVDAEGIQLRIFAHLIDDPEFTDALVRGRKDDKTDPHSLNQRILGSVCRSRQAAKRFIYALLLGAGNGKLAEILECSQPETDQALTRLMDRYQKWRYLKEQVFPKDAKRGWFEGLDGRKVVLPGDTEGTKRHLAMSGYLQNGEAIVMKKATLRFLPLLPKSCFLVNFVHDEWQTEVPNNMEIALLVASLQADSLRIVGEELNLKCPLAGSYWNDDNKDYTIATNWSKTH